MQRGLPAIMNDRTTSRSETVAFLFLLRAKPAPAFEVLAGFLRLVNAFCTIALACCRTLILNGKIILEIDFLFFDIILPL